MKIKVGDRVQLKRTVVVKFGFARGDVTVPAGSVGRVRYLPKEEDPGAHNDLGVTWYRHDDSSVGVEVPLDAVSEIAVPNLLGAISRLLLHSWKDINYRYSGLTKDEKLLITPAEFIALVAWIDPESPNWKM